MRTLILAFSAVHPDNPAAQSIREQNPRCRAVPHAGSAMHSLVHQQHRGGTSNTRAVKRQQVLTGPGSARTLDRREPARPDGLAALGGLARRALLRLQPQLLLVGLCNFISPHALKTSHAPRRTGQINVHSNSSASCHCPHTLPSHDAFALPCNSHDISWAGSASKPSYVAFPQLCA